MDLQVTEQMQKEFKALNFQSLDTLSEGETLGKANYDELLEKYASRFGIYESDFATYKFRPHAIGNLMGGLPKPLTERQEETLQAFQEKITEGKGLTEKQHITYGSLLAKKTAKPTLNSGAKTYLKTLFKEITFQRTKELRNKYLDKGLAVENESIAMLNEFLNTYFEKNDKRFENDYFTGEPDIILKDEIIDIKSSWDYTTFPMMDDEVSNQMYYYQLQAYMDLLGMQKARLIYVLVDTPMELIYDEKRRVSWQLGTINEELKFDLPEDLEFEIERNLTYEDIPQEARIKIFEVERNNKDIQLMKQIVELARQYLLKLNQSLEQRFNKHLVRK